MKAIDKLRNMISAAGGNIVIDKSINFYGKTISGKIARIEVKDDEFIALVDSDGFLFSEEIPKNQINDNFVNKVQEKKKKKKV